MKNKTISFDVVVAVEDNKTERNLSCFLGNDDLNASITFFRGFGHFTFLI